MLLLKGAAARARLTTHTTRAAVVSRKSASLLDTLSMLLGMLVVKLTTTWRFSTGATLHEGLHLRSRGALRSGLLCTPFTKTAGPSARRAIALQSTDIYLHCMGAT